jgi:hypothetical protein
LACRRVRPWSANRHGVSAKGHEEPFQARTLNDRLGSKAVFEYATRRQIGEASGCEAHYREAEDLGRRASEAGNQIRNTKPVTLAGAIALLEWAHDGGCCDEPLTNAVIAGLRDLQPKASRISPGDDRISRRGQSAAPKPPFSPRVRDRLGTNLSTVCRATAELAGRGI